MNNTFMAVNAADLPRQLGSGHDWHDEVCRQQVDGPGMGARKPECFVGIPGALDPIALQAQELHDERQHLNLIVDDEDGRRGDRR
jgi:hypothetical protein